MGGGSVNGSKPVRVSVDPIRGDADIVELSMDEISVKPPAQPPKMMSGHLGTSLRKLSVVAGLQRDVSDADAGAPEEKEGLARSSPSIEDSETSSERVVNRM